MSPGEEPGARATSTTNFRRGSGFALPLVAERWHNPPVPMQRIYAGTRVKQSAIERYAKKFNLLEVRPEPDAPLSARTLRKWRKSVPPTFAFSVVLPPIVAELRTGEAVARAIDETLEMARLLESPVLVIQNPASVRPTATNKSRLANLVERLPHDVVKLAWEPSGLWEDDDARRVASDLGLVLVGDAAREPLAPGSVAYTRLRGLGDSRRLSLARMDKLIANLRPYREVFVVIETERPAAVAKAVHASAMDVGDERAPRVRHIHYPMHAEDEEQE